MQISDPRFSKRMSLLAYTPKTSIPSCLLTRGDELSEKTATTYSPTVTQYHRRDQA